MKVVLTEKDFSELLKGNSIVKKDAQDNAVEIALSDIGYDKIVNIVADQLTVYINRRWLYKK